MYGVTVRRFSRLSFGSFMEPASDEFFFDCSCVNLSNSFCTFLVTSRCIFNDLARSCLGLSRPRQAGQRGLLSADARRFQELFEDSSPDCIDGEAPRQFLKKHCSTACDHSPRRAVPLSYPPVDEGTDPRACNHP